MKKQFMCISKSLSFCASLLGFLLLQASFNQLVRAESLWMNKMGSERSMYADKSARARGDILTVEVNETSSMRTAARTDTDKEASINNSVTQWLFTPEASKFGTHNGELPATDIDGDNEYSGGGPINNNHTLNARASVMVIDVLPNGNLVIEGVRVVTFSGETQFAVLRGFVRPYDVSPDNTVDSDRIADARVEFISEGTLTDAQREGWLLRLNRYINPF